MITLKESLLDDEEELINDQWSIIKGWIEKHYTITPSSDNLSFHDGIVDAVDCALSLDRDADTLTQGLFRWGKVSAFIADYCEDLISLEGAPEQCEHFSC